MRKRGALGLEYTTLGEKSLQERQGSLVSDRCVEIKAFSKTAHRGCARRTRASAISAFPYESFSPSRSIASGFRLSLVFYGVELIDQRPSADSQFFGRVCAIALAFFKHGKNGCSFDLREPSCGVSLTAAGQGRHLGRQVLGQNDIATAEQARSLDSVS
jgi:hypothetical protein